MSVMCMIMSVMQIPVHVASYMLYTNKHSYYICVNRPGWAANTVIVKLSAHDLI